MPTPPITARNNRVLTKKMLRHEKRMERIKKRVIRKKFRRHRKWQTSENKRMMRKSLRKMKKERRKNYRKSEMRKDDPFILEE